MTKKWHLLICFRVNSKIVSTSFFEQSNFEQWIMSLFNLSVFQILIINLQGWVKFAQYFWEGRELWKCFSKYLILRFKKNQVEFRFWKNNFSLFSLKTKQHHSSKVIGKLIMPTNKKISQRYKFCSPDLFGLLLN